MKRTYIVLLAILFLGCNDRYSADNFLGEDHQQELLVDIVTYIYSKPKGATTSNMFDKSFRKYYSEATKQFRLSRYFVAEDGTRYYYIIRPAAGVGGRERGVGGSFRLDQNGKINSFREVFNTPVADKTMLDERGREMFGYLVKHENVDPYLPNPDFVEWPSKVSRYDTVKFEWVAK